MNKPRILIIENSIAVTGALNSILRSSAGLSSAFEFIFLMPSESKALNYVRDQGFQTVTLPLREIRKDAAALLAYLPTLFSNALKLKKIIAKHNIDLMVVNDFYNLLPVLYHFLGGHVPHVCYVRFLPSKFPASLVKLWSGLQSRTAYTTIAVSEAVKRELPQGDVSVIGSELPAEEVSFVPPGSNILLYPANYIQGKGHEYALTSFALIAKKHPDWTLHFVGGDMGLQKNRDFKKSLAAQASDLGLNDQVQWHDFSENISNEYLKAAVVLNFSESESFSMTCFVGMFYGRPVIATRCGGPSEIIDHGETGLLVDIADTQAMATAMDHLIKNPAERHTMANAAYDRIRKKFSFENTIGKLGLLYAEAIRK